MVKSSVFGCAECFELRYRVEKIEKAIKLRKLQDRIAKLRG
jgi:hypothetical protein